MFNKRVQRYTFSIAERKGGVRGGVDERTFSKVSRTESSTYFEVHPGEFVPLPFNHRHLTFALLITVLMSDIASYFI